MAKVYILVGNIASTKSTFALEKTKTQFDIHIINQDILGSRENCIKAAKIFLASTWDIIIDRTNISKSQRNHWIQLAKKYNAEVHLIEFKTSPEKCLERALNRKDHPTIKNMSEEKIKSIIARFEKEYEAPEMSEGFISHITIMVDNLPSQ